MDYAIIKVPAAPVRRKAKHQGEMTNQLLFGDTLKVLKKKAGKWLKVRNLADGYEGWITDHLAGEITEKDAKAGIVAPYVTADLISTVITNQVPMHVPAGASLPNWDGAQGNINGLRYQLEGKFIKRIGIQPEVSLIKSTVAPWLNAPYMWGGKTIFGVDCSGFVQVNFKMLGIDLSRDAWQQAQEGKMIDKLKDAECGDLAFFDDHDEIVHVGMLLSNDTIIHASGKVRIDHIDKKGIVNADTNKRTHSLRVIKRYW
ncbi:MAG: hypothetical protein DI535_18355 [Citrobacter freundii]|nr:MAG: hypothetical protein DI535_18355 [Citrobacter freundii]